MDVGRGDKSAINVKNENKFSGKAIKSWGSKLKDILARMGGLWSCKNCDALSLSLTRGRISHTHTEKTYLNTNSHAPKSAKGIWPLISCMSLC